MSIKHVSFYLGESRNCCTQPSISNNRIRSKNHIHQIILKVFTHSLHETAPDINDMLPEWRQSDCRVHEPSSESSTTADVVHELRLRRDNHKNVKALFRFHVCIDFSFSCLTHEVERKRIFCEWVRSRIPSRRLWNPTSNRNKSSLLFFYCVREQHFIVYVLIFFLRHHNRTVIFYPLLFPTVPAAHTILGINEGIKIFYEGLVSRNCYLCTHSDIAMNVNNLAGINLNLNLYKPLRPPPAAHPPPNIFILYIPPRIVALQNRKAISKPRQCLIR